MAVLYGLLQQADLASERLTTVGTDLVMDAVNQSLAEHNRQLDALMSLFVTRRTDFKTRFQIANAWRLQPLDENGRALPVKPSGYYDVSWPIQMAGTAWGFNWVTREKITVGEVARITAGHMEADVRWMRDHVLAALFYKNGTSPWTFSDPLNGTLSIYGLANGDTTVYSIAAGATAAATDDHLLFDATVAADTFTTIYDELMEHPENGGEVIAFIPTNLKATVEALATFYPIEDPDLRIGTGNTVLAGRLGTAVPGTVLGKIEKVWVVEWKHLPNDYILGLATEGERALAMREDEEQALRGFKLRGERDDHPWYEQQFARRAGFGAWNRVNAIVVKAAASYTVPTGYDSPLG